MIEISYIETENLNADTSIGADDVIVTKTLRSAFDAAANHLPETPEFERVPSFRAEVRFGSDADLASWTGKAKTFSTTLFRTWDAENEAYVVKKTPVIAVNVTGLTQAIRASDSSQRALTGVVMATMQLLNLCCIHQALGHTDLSAIYDPASDQVPDWIQEHFLDHERALHLLQWCFIMYGLDTHQLTAGLKSGSTTSQ